MAFMFDYIRQINIHGLEENEVIQCLLYLDYLQSDNPDIRRKSRSIRKKLDDRLLELKGAQK
ncbi:hypothetical protein OB13_09175 [Pontibacter sp. HJ8]|jgi:hypothetical protein